MVKSSKLIWVAESFGNRIIAFFEMFGGLVIFFMQSIKVIPTSTRLTSKVTYHMYFIGIKSVPIALFTAIFVDMAFTLQIINEFVKFGAGDMIGGIVGLAVWRELAPLLTGVVVCGRVGAAITSELSSMKVTQQIEALEALSQNPIAYLVTPRLIACILMLPLLIGISSIVGIFAGLLIAQTKDISPYSYYTSLHGMLTLHDIIGGLSKGIFFGILIAIVSCYMGFASTGGAKGVGDSTTLAVVVSMLSIFILNYILSLMLFM